MKTADYIVIGAGSAGCIMANRLSADGARVVLLEAGGPDRHPYIHIPGAYIRLFKKKFDWGFWTEPQAALDGRKIYIPRGKMLGGCSSNNAMAYVRGNAGDYNEWAALGNEGWGFEEVLPYFLKSEGNANADELDPGYHSSKGELYVQTVKEQHTAYGKAFVEAAQQAGLPKCADYNGKDQHGVGFFQFTIKDGKRFSSADAFLKPILNRPNFEAVTHALVERISIENGRATGVVFKKGKTSHTIKANKEVILCAGAINSPQILMLSGIGDRAYLQSKGIDSVHHLPGVGQNLQDHLFCGLAYRSNDNQGINHYIKTLPQLGAFGKYLFQKKGVLTASPLEAFGFININGEDAHPDFQFHFCPIHAGEGYDYDMYDAESLPRDDGYTLLPSLVKPKSVGYVGLHTKTPGAAPLIQPNFLSAPEDMQTMIKGFRKGYEILEQSAFDPFRQKRVAPLGDMNDDQVIIDHIKKSVETIYHPVGTCKMGHDEMAVVDDELRMHGLEGLRVVDASIMPTIVTGNTNAPVYMIAEKAADMILNGKKVNAKAVEA
ncbi:MAG: GMC family oxidoreductase N-terminal domain-containing protein [Bacteroidota bacterium]